MKFSILFLVQDIQNQADDFRRQILDITTDIEREIDDVRMHVLGG